MQIKELELEDRSRDLGFSRVNFERGLHLVSASFSVLAHPQPRASTDPNPPYSAQAAEPPERVTRSRAPARRRARRGLPTRGRHRARSRGLEVEGRCG